MPREYDLLVYQDLNLHGNKIKNLTEVDSKQNVYVHTTKEESIESGEGLSILNKTTGNLSIANNASTSNSGGKVSIESKNSSASLKAKEGISIENTSSNDIVIENKASVVGNTGVLVLKSKGDASLTSSEGTAKVSGNGDVVLTSTGNNGKADISAAKAVTVKSTSDTLTLQGEGDTKLESTGANSDLYLKGKRNASLESEGGNLSLTSSGNISESAYSGITVTNSTSGNISIMNNASNGEISTSSKGKTSISSDKKIELSASDDVFITSNKDIAISSGGYPRGVSINTTSGDVLIGNSSNSTQILGDNLKIQSGRTSPTISNGVETDSGSGIETFKVDIDKAVRIRWDESTTSLVFEKLGN